MKMKKALAFLTGLMMVLPSAAVTAFAAEDSDSAVPPVAAAAVPHLFAAPANIPIEEHIDQIQQQIHRELPSRFDLREYGLVSPIRNQGALGTCWAHATLGSIETERMAEDPSIDLAERYLATYIKSEEFGDGTKDFSKGANANTAMGLLSNWIGAVPESLAPYDEEYISDSTREEMQQESKLHVTGIHEVDVIPYSEDPELFEANQKLIKQAICDGHGLYFTVIFNYEYNDIYNDPMNPGPPDMNHAVVVVGYDDNYSADNFQGVKPPADGAWLVKNSWGADSGYGGYYWVSYCDLTIGTAYYFDVTPAEEHDHLYSNDDYGSCGEFAAAEEGDECVYISNIYTAKENGFVTDVMMNINCADDNYEITVYTDLADPAVPTSGEAHAATVGKAEHTGYMTVTLDEPVHINEGEAFAVVAKLSGNLGYHIACEFAPHYTENGVGFSQSSISGSTNSSSLINEARIMETFGANQSFFSTDGCNWTDVYDSYEYDEIYLTGNICLRAMTSDEGKVKFSSYSDALAPGTELTLSSADGRNIYYSIDGGEFTLYTAPITFTQEMTVSAYAEGDEENIYTRHYAEKHAMISSLLVQYDIGSSVYADLTGAVDIEVDPSANSLVLLPMTTGTVTDGETVTGSYEPRELSCSLEPFTVTLTAEEEGLNPTVYTLHIHKAFPEQFSSGIWISSEQFGWFNFNDDGKTGYYISREDGSKQEISYTIADNRITFKEGDNIRKGLIIGSSENVTIQWDDGSEEVFYFNSYSEPDHAVYLTNPELIEIVNTYMTARTGKAPKSVTAECDEADKAFVNLHVTAADGTKYVFRIDAQNAVGFDQDGNIVDLRSEQEDTGITEIKPGIWALRQEIQGYTSLMYYCFDKNGKNFVLMDANSGQKYSGTYRLENGQLVLSGEYISEQMAVRLHENSIDLTWGYGSRATMNYLSDAAPEEFTFLNDSELRQLADEYYAAAHLTKLQFGMIYSLDCEMVEMYSYDVTTGEEVVYTVSRFTGLGTDQNGCEINLFNPIEAENQDYFTKGIWRSILTENDVFTYFDYYYWLGDQSDNRVVMYNAYHGNQFSDIMTYRMIDGNGCFVHEDGSRDFFTYTKTDYGMELNFIYTEGEFTYTKTEKLVFVKESEQEDVKFYSVAKLTDMALTDYSVKHNGAACEFINANTNEDGNVYIDLIDPNTGELAAVYIVDQFSGLGTTSSGEELNLPQTGINAPDTLLLTVAAFMMTGFGFWSVKHSGIIRKKEEAEN